MDVLVIGAGIAGLACARQLMSNGHAVTVIDKGRGVGGRLATRRLGAASFDTGAQFISARECAFVDELLAAGAIVWSYGFPRLGGDSVADGHPRYVMPGGMNRLAKHLAQGVVVRDQLTVTSLALAAGRWQVTCAPNQILTAEAVVLTAPAPQAVQLLSGCGFSVPHEVSAVRYDPCLCLMLDYPHVSEALMPRPGGMQVTDDAAIGWVSSQGAKGLRNVGDGIIVHATGAWSAAHYAHSDEEIINRLRPLAEAVLRRIGITATAADCQLKKWKYSLPTVTVAAAYVRVPAAAPLLLAGDAFGGRPRVEGAWLSGRAAAALVE